MLFFYLAFSQTLLIDRIVKWVSAGELRRWNASVFVNLETVVGPAQSCHVLVECWGEASAATLRALESRTASRDDFNDTLNHQAFCLLPLAFRTVNGSVHSSYLRSKQSPAGPATTWPTQRFHTSTFSRRCFL